MELEVHFFFSGYYLKVVYICTRFRENILDGIKVMERTRVSLKKISKGHISVKYVDGVTVLFLCTLSDGGLYLYKVS